MISMLLSHPLNDLTVTDKFGKTPFAVAMATKNNKAAQLIADRHPSAVDMYDVRGRTYLHAAVQRGDLEGMLFLLSLGVDVNARTRDSDRFTPLHLAIKNATNAVAPGVSESIVRHLLLAGSDPNASTVRRITPGHLAIATPDLLQILLDGGADPNSVDDEHFNFLHTAMKESRLPAVRVLLRHGKVNTTDAEGNSALLLGYMRGHSGLCKSLVKYGACLGTPNKQGVTIFNYQLATKTLLLRLLDCVGCEPPWAESETCLECGNRFSLTTRKHHCRHCGRILCSKCSSSVIPIIKFGLNKPIRVCQLCFDVLTLGAS
ncbi:unnamed protein product [Cyprideis torosa]|uniref:Uncharacterized protein n=1 Tax=Cyprideis torosa TaxID=163714 RepID=A0A7R8WN67_9CRUS|nr:unnamed protein product [Cyprideis torosa]CAG0905970.1 unnamed protein product [Cyprideis torosa]